MTNKGPSHYTSLHIFRYFVRVGPENVFAFFFTPIFKKMIDCLPRVGARLILKGPQVYFF